MTWKCHVDDSNAGRCDIIIDRDLLNKLGIDIKISMNTIECSEGPYQGCTTPIVNIDDYDFEPINIEMRPFPEE